MLSGHSYSRALRGHFLAQTALVHLLFDEVEHELDEATREKATELANQLQSNTIPPEAAAHHPVIAVIREKLKATMSRLSQSRTALLWINYFEMVQIMRLFLRAERCGDWFMSLQSTKQMVPYFLAAGHFNYFKACNTYLQQMRTAQSVMPPDEFSSFAGGRFTIRTQEKFWDGVWTDMIIEQKLMRFLKVSEGITRGRGTTDKVIARLLQALPVTSKFVAAIETFTGTRMIGSEQHVELRLERQKRDRNDLEKFTCWLSQHSPFADRPPDKLVSISSGIIGDAHTNCDSAFEVGMAEWRKCVGTPLSSLTLRRNARVRTFASVGVTSKAGVDPTLSVRPEQLFHRILCRMNEQGSAGVLLPESLAYELDHFPPSLFEKSIMREPSKASFMAIINGYIAGEKCPLPPTPSYTVDGGFLLHRVPWPDFATFNTVCDVYLSYVKNAYGPLCHVVFDGYERNGIKDHTHMRRQGKSLSADIEVSAGVPVGCSREAFLGNTSNKVQLIKLLSSRLRQAGVEVTQDTGDADRSIVLAAIEKAERGMQSVLVGEDMDLFVLLTVLLPPQNNVLILKPGRSNAEDQIFSGHTIQIKMGEWVDYLLLVYAFTGCDSTSAPYQRGKVKSWKKFITASPALLSDFKEFRNPNLNHEKVADIGEKLMLFLYGRSATEGLNKSREKLYQEFISKQNPGQVFEIKTLPPTSQGCRQHSFRAYIQVQEWQGRRLKPELWGWIWDQSVYRPNPSDKPPAPPSILDKVLCNCAMECEEHCECRGSGLRCSQMCGNCAGIGCSNTPVLCPTEDSDEDPDDPDG
ncbi:hypothetical protein FOCC_FOCC006402 [Frankliniella occidentalis]|nr:hypothetical protein FOCC_FOCC006402 [Frankliniella occidentalis]